MKMFELKDEITRLKEENEQLQGILTVIEIRLVHFTLYGSGSVVERFIAISNCLLVTFLKFSNTANASEGL